jgi:hypothetical protein
MKKALVVLCMAVFAGATHAKADNIQTIGQYTGGFYSDPGPYQPPTVVGTFDILPGDTSMTISGTFGNSLLIPSSSGVNLYLGSILDPDDILVASCVENAPCWEDVPPGTPTPWTDTLTATQIASLGTGTVDFTAVQTSAYIVQLGTTTLDQAPGTSPVPEPSSIALFATGLLGCVGAVRRKLLNA